MGFLRDDTKDKLPTSAMMGQRTKKWLNCKGDRITYSLATSGQVRTR